MPITGKCPVCSLDSCEKNSRINDCIDYKCMNCGTFRITRTAEALLIHKVNNSNILSAALSHRLRRMYNSTELPMIDSNTLLSIIENPYLPSPMEQVNNLIIWLGDTIEGLGNIVDVMNNTHQGIIGASCGKSVEYIIKTLIRKGYIEGDLIPFGGGRNLTLTLDGWTEYERLKKGLSESRKAFMAMPFGNAILDQVFNDVFKAAVRQTGYELLRLDEDPKAGLIDDRLRVTISTSRFLITELTDGNKGAYWEAGYAEGLGKPVIYTCEKNFFDRQPPYENLGGTHFDTNHHLTIIWNSDNFAQAAEDLKATIRATLPGEAKMMDD